MYNMIIIEHAAVMYMRLVDAVLPPTLIMKANANAQPFLPARIPAKLVCLVCKAQKIIMSATASPQPQWSVEVPNTSRPSNHTSGGRGNIRRSYDPLASPTLGALGVRTLYEALRRGRDINPLGPCLGYRATRYG